MFLRFNSFTEISLIKPIFLNIRLSGMSRTISSPLKYVNCHHICSIDPHSLRGAMVQKNFREHYRFRE